MREHAGPQIKTRSCLDRIFNGVNVSAYTLWRWFDLSICLSPIGESLLVCKISCLASMTGRQQESLARGGTRGGGEMRRR
jgi:hypothetical protein